MNLTLNNQPPFNHSKFEKWVVAICLVILALLLFSSCSCNYHLKRLKSKCGEPATEVVTIHDTIITKEYKRDTLFKYFQRDTVIVREGKLTMKYFYHSNDSTIYLRGNCAADTIYKEVKVPVETTKVTIDYFPKWFIFTLILLIVGLVVLWVLKKI